MDSTSTQSHPAQTYLAHFQLLKPNSF